MFDTYRSAQFDAYKKARAVLVSKPEILIGLEQFFAEHLRKLIEATWKAIKADYDEASYLYPFWQNYPPLDRGRQPKGDQFPWIEVGEHAAGERLARILGAEFAVRDVGLPTGCDQRFLVSATVIKELSSGFTDSVFVFVDIKGVGPRDDAPHAVMSHNQVSGDGRWTVLREGVKNTVVRAIGPRSQHDFHCGLPPIYVLSDGTVAPVVTIALKPVYSMLSLTPGSKDRGQPLSRIVIAAIPNGLLSGVNPNYLKQHPGLFFPGKDDQAVPLSRRRARVSFEILSLIAKWRVYEVEGTAKPPLVIG